MGKKKKTHSKIRIELEYIGFRLLYNIMYHLSLKTAYRLARWLFKCLFWIDKKHRVRSIQHLMHAGMTKDPREALKWACASYLEFSKLLVEIVKMNQLYSLDKISVGGDPEACKYAFEDGNQVIIATAHFGNWEVAGTAFSERARRPMVSLMRPFSNPRIGELILGHRASKVHEVVSKKEGVRPLVRALLHKKNATLLIDQHAAGSEGVVCEFFGHPAQVHMTPALLHLKSGVPILPELTVRVDDEFHFELRAGKLIRYTPTGDKAKDVQAITQLCINELEKMIREAPLQWLWAPRHWLDINRGPYPPPAAPNSGNPEKA